MIKRYNSKRQRLFKTIIIKIFPEAALLPEFKGKHRNKHIITRKYLSSAKHGYNEDNINVILEKVSSEIEKQWPQAEFRLVEPKDYALRAV